MEIKVQVEISLSKSSETFLQNLINSVLNANIRETSAAAPSRPSVKAEDANESPVANTECSEQAVQKQTEKPEKVVTEAAKPEKVATEKPDESSEEKQYTVEFVRELGKKYINTHRNEIKAKLTELGAQNITKLNPAYYAEFVEYIESITK